MIAIETERLHIRNFGASDWQALQDMIVHYQALESARYEPAWPTSDLEIQTIAEWFAAGDDYLCVCLKATGTLIGLLAIECRSSQAEQVRNLGYVFHPVYHEQGYALESCRAIIDYVFTQLAAAAIRTGTHPANAASLRLLRALGLRQIGPGEFTLSREEWRAADSASSRRLPY